MGTVLRVPTYTYYDANTKNFQTSFSLVMSDDLLTKVKAWHTTYGESGVVKEWTGTDLSGIPGLVNNFLGFPLMSKKSNAGVLPVPTIPDKVSALIPWLADVYTKCYIPYSLHTGITDPTPSKVVTLSNVTLNTTSYGSGSVTGRTVDGYVLNAELGDNLYTFVSQFWTTNHWSFKITYNILPEDFIIGNGFNPEYQTGGSKVADTLHTVEIELHGSADGPDTDPSTTHFSVNTVQIRVPTRSNIGYISYLLGGMSTTSGSGAVEYDEDNPYGEEGTSNIGGGDGAYGDPDATDGAEIPDLPSISAADLGFITMYNPTAAQLKSLSDFMWSSAFDLVTYKKLFSDPMQSIIGLAIVPVQPSVAGNKNVMFGTIDSGISMNYLSTNYVQMDCGSVSIDKYVGCFMDNDPYTKISIYLPFIGIRQISADDCMGRSIHVVYNIDVLTGACACFIEVSGKGVLYSYNGSCITNVPLTAVNFSGAIQNAVSAIGSALGIAAGMATGAAPVTAMSLVGLATSAANTAVNSKPTVQRSGNLGGSAGIMSIMTPYVIIERPRMSVPNKVEQFVGQTSNITMYLNDCKGFTMCEYVHLDNLNATSEEIVEIESMLRSGVIF